MRQVRARSERVQQGDLAGAVGDAQALASAVDEAAGRVERARAALAAATGSRDGPLGAANTTISAIAHRERYLRRLRGELDAVRGELLRAEARHRGQLDVVDVARGRLALARAEREIIERHFAAWRAERRKLAERRED